MKKISFLLLIFIAASTSTFASHYVGGEIYWRCIQGTGKYIFYMDMYRDCKASSASINTNPITLKVYNNPLPNNGALSSLVITFVPPDPGTPLGPNGGASVAPLCNGCANSAQPISCTNQDQGTLEKYSYRSQPITLSGKPPAAGWVFSSPAFYARSRDIKNLVNPDNFPQIYKAIMYGDGRASQDPCYDSSPQFKEAPSVLVCEGYDFQFNHNATDDELDSLAYHWADAVNTGGNGTQYTPTICQWAPGYSRANPTPTAAMNPLNKSATIDPLTGEIRMHVILPANVPANTAGIFVTSAQVDAYGLHPVTGQRVKTATVFRDMPFNVFRCPPISFIYNDVNGNPVQVTEVNKPPFVQIGATSGSLSLDTVVYAGDLVSISFLAVDTNVSPCSPTLLTEVSVEPSGYQFDKSFNDPQGNCPIKPCATLTPAPSGAPVKRLRGLSTVGTKFNWQTTCDHLNPVGIQQLTTGRFTFVMKVYDDFCPIPAINYPTINITLKAPEPIGPPVIRCVSIQEDDSYVITWTGPVFPDTTNSFDSYELFMLQRPAGTNLTFGLLPAPIAIGITDYEGSYTVPANAFAPGMEYAFKMKSRHGCGGLLLSDLSELMTTTNRLKATYSGTLPANDPNRFETKVTLSWKSLFNAPSNYGPRHPLLMGTSMLQSWDSTFYIYQRHTPHNAGPWVLIDSVIQTDTSKFKWTGGSPVCDDLVSFKIMSRDTSANCESFSNVVIKNMKSIIPPDEPKMIDYSVLPNGDVFLNWATLSNSADSYVIYSSNAAGIRINKLDSVVVPNNSYTHIGAGANLNERFYIIVPYDTCNKTVEGKVTKVKTSLLNGQTIFIGPDSCEVAVKLDWSIFQGFIDVPIINPPNPPIPADPVNRYEIYSTINSVSTLIGTVNGVGNRTFTYPVLSNTTYEFSVLAKTGTGLSARSSTFNVTTGKVPDKYVVAPPDLRCIRFVGTEIELEWLKPENPRNNFLEYRIYRQNNGGAWNEIDDESDYLMTTYKDATPGANPKYKVSSVSNYCNVEKDSVSTKVVSPIVLGVANYADSTKGPQLELGWNNTGIFPYTNPFQILRDSSVIAPSNVFKTDTIVQQTVLSFLDADSCTRIGRYFIQVMDTSGCYSTSNIASETFRDGGEPTKQYIDYVTVDYTNINNLSVKIVWTDNLSTDVKKYFIERPLTAFPITNITIETDGEARSVNDIVNLTDTTYTYTIFAEDSCSSKSKGPYDNATTIDIDSKFLICDSAVELTWNNYEWFRSGAEVVYEVYSSQTKVFADFVKVGNTTRNEFTHEGVLSGDNYYYVKAVDLNGAGPFFSNSNLTQEFVEYPDPPAFQYMHSVFVNSPSFIEIQCYVDTMALVKGYEIFRGVDSSSLVKLDQVGIDAVVDGFVSYEDYNVVSDEGSYYYRINALDSCGNLSIASNLGKSIFLTNTTDNLALTNTLKWTAYEDWRNGVSHYLIYKAENNKFGVDAFDTLYVEPNMGDVITYIDDVSNYADSKTDFVKNGQYCYYVVAVENGKGVPTDPNITPGMALSNAVCTNMQPTMYIPNAFSPGTGVNNVFRPEGIYFDFTRYEMIIYNRWGEVVFESTDYYKGWDGALSGGKFAPIGTYVYTIRFIDSNGQERSKKGTLTIVR